MNKLVLKILLLISIILPANAANLEKIKYKNIENNSRISANNSFWSLKINKKDRKYFIKKEATEDSNYSTFYSADGELLFSTGTQYEFIHKNCLIGYSNFDLKFYEFELKNDFLSRRELSYDEIQDLFPEYKIIKMSDFSANTNSIKIKKKSRKLKLILLNDTDRYFYNYSFTSRDSHFKEYSLKGFLNITKKGMIQFAKFGENTKNSPWYIILIR